jgi:hypothetical protein
MTKLGGAGDGAVFACRTLQGSPRCRNERAFSGRIVGPHYRHAAIVFDLTEFAAARPRWLPAACRIGAIQEAESEIR